MIAATDWTAVAAIGTFAAVLVAVGATIFAAFQGKWDRDAANESATADRRIAAETLDEMRKEREDRTRGHLSFRWVRSEAAPRNRSRKGTAYLLTVKNSGGPVRDVDFHLSGPVGQLLNGDPMEEHRWFHIDFIASGDTVEPYSEWTLDFLPHQKRDELPMVADVTYTDGLGTHQVQRRIESDT